MRKFVLMCCAVGLLMPLGGAYGHPDVDWTTDDDLGNADLCSYVDEIAVDEDLQNLLAPRMGIRDHKPTKHLPGKNQDALKHYGEGRKGLLSEAIRKGVMLDQMELAEADKEYEELNMMGDE